MALTLTPELLRAAGEVVSAAATPRAAAAAWRAQYPGMRMLVVDALDMRDETPALQLGARNLYLAATNGHCWHVTGQPEEASALILTQE
ncbi:MAG TPA: hypothetical protein VGC24_10905 [Burkholderiaceae bacterium]